MNIVLFKENLVIGQIFLAFLNISLFSGIDSIHQVVPEPFLIGISTMFEQMVLVVLLEVLGVVELEEALAVVLAVELEVQYQPQYRGRRVDMVRGTDWMELYREVLPNSKLLRIQRALATVLYELLHHFERYTF